MNGRQHTVAMTRLLIIYVTYIRIPIHSARQSVSTNQRGLHSHVIGIYGWCIGGDVCGNVRRAMLPITAALCRRRPGPLICEFRCTKLKMMAEFGWFFDQPNSANRDDKPQIPTEEYCTDSQCEVNRNDVSSAHEVRQSLSASINKLRYINRLNQNTAVITRNGGDF